MSHYFFFLSFPNYLSPDYLQFSAVLAILSLSIVPNLIWFTLCHFFIPFFDDLTRMGGLGETPVGGCYLTRMIRCINPSIGILFNNDWLQGIAWRSVVLIEILIMGGGLFFPLFLLLDDEPARSFGIMHQCMYVSCCPIIFKAEVWRLKGSAIFIHW